jgi:hypothetical protein
MSGETALHALQAIAEGDPAIEHWDTWWQKHGRGVSALLGRIGPSCLYLRPYEEACRILSEHGVTYRPSPANAWLDTPDLGSSCRQCPKCGARAMVPILYGVPTSAAFALVESGRATLGGCFFQVGAPLWDCSRCNERTQRAR